LIFVSSSTAQNNYIFYEKSRSGNKAGAIHVQTYKTTHIQLDVILTQSDAKLLLYVLKSFAG
jgi:hypothetical protein